MNQSWSLSIGPWFSISLSALRPICPLVANSDFYISVIKHHPITQIFSLPELYLANCILCLPAIDKLKPQGHQKPQTDIPIKRSLTKKVPARLLSNITQTHKPSSLGVLLKEDIFQMVATAQKCLMVWDASPLCLPNQIKLWQASTTSNHLFP